MSIVKKCKNDFEENIRNFVIGLIIGSISLSFIIVLILCFRMFKSDTKTYVGQVNYSSQNYIVITDANGKEYAFETGGDWLAQEGSVYIIKVDGSHIRSLVPVALP